MPQAQIRKTPDNDLPSAIVRAAADLEAALRSCETVIRLADVAVADPLANREATRLLFSWRRKWVHARTILQAVIDGFVG